MTDTPETESATDAMDLSSYSPGVKLDDDFIPANEVNLPPVPRDAHGNPISTHLYFCVALLFARVPEGFDPKTEEDLDLAPDGMMMQMVSFSRAQQEELALRSKLDPESPEFLSRMSNQVVDMATSVTMPENMRRGLIILGGNAMPLNEYVVYAKEMPSISRPPAPDHGDN